MIKISLGDGLFTVIDNSDYDKVSKYPWSVNRSNYATTTIDGVTTLLHRFLIKVPVGMVVDHIDGDKQWGKFCNGKREFIVQRRVDGKNVPVKK